MPRKVIPFHAPIEPNFTRNSRPFQSVDVLTASEYVTLEPCDIADYIRHSNQSFAYDAISEALLRFASESEPS